MAAIAGFSDVLAGYHYIEVPDSYKTRLTLGFMAVCTLLLLMGAATRFSIRTLRKTVTVLFAVGCLLTPFSVGYKTDYEMCSMDFEEFLWARGYSEEQVEGITNHMVSLLPFNDIEQTVFRSAFLDYCVLGGMPAVVSTFVRSGTFEGTLAIQKQLVADYREDIQKYAEGLDKARILNVFDHTPVQLAKENKKYQLSKVEKGARFKDYLGCIDWLKVSGMAEVCYCLNFPELPLKGNYDDSKCKLYFSDTGLLVAMLDDEASEDLRANKNLGVYKGALYESIAADALTRQGYGLFYFKKEDSTLEEDFFVRTADFLVPIEVKARNGRSKSLRTLLASESYPDIRFDLRVLRGRVAKAILPRFLYHLKQRRPHSPADRPSPTSSSSSCLE